MNKAELIEEVANATGMSKSAAAESVDAVFDVITSCLKRGDTATVVGFGTFAVSDRAARTGRNPRTGEAITIPASRSPKFKAGKALKDAVN